MRLVKSFTAVAAASMLVAGGAVALAGPAAAIYEGPTLSGNVLWFDQAGSLDTQTAAHMITSGKSPTNGVNPRPFQALALDQPCPAGTTNIALSMRVPQTGVPEDDWTEVLISPGVSTKDAEGRFYLNQVDVNGAFQVDRLNKSELLTYNLTSPGNTGQFPFIVSCKDDGAIPLGNFRTILTLTGTVANDYSWSIPASAFPAAPLTATTTTLAAPSSVEAGSPVALTATVAPAAATGAVTFTEGATTVGTGTLNAGVATLSTSTLAIGQHSLTASYAGDTTFAASTSAAVNVTVTTAAPRATTTTLQVSPVTGAAYQTVTFTPSVTAVSGLANGTVTITSGATVLGSSPVVDGVAAPISTNVLGAGTFSLVASFTGTAPYVSSASAPVAATYTLVGAAVDQTAVVAIPAGAITITTPYTPAAPIDLGTATLDPTTSTYSASADVHGIVITDSRAGNLGFTASVVSGAFTSAAGGTFGGNYAGLTGVKATQLAGNALLASALVLTDNAPFAPGIGSPKVFATYAAGQSIGTAQLAGTFGIDKVPSSVTPGLYTATVTFTAV